MAQQVTYSLPSIAFGAAEWNKYFGDVGVEPPLPSDINMTLDAPCPFWPDKKVQDTHLLVLVPQTVNARPLTLKLLGELVKKPLQGSATQYQYFHLGQYTDPAVPKSHWTLLTRDVVDGSRNEPYSGQQALIKAPYEVPAILDATVAIFTEHVRTGTRLYSDSRWTATWCREKFDADWQLTVGGFSSAGLSIRVFYGVYEHLGVGGLMTQPITPASQNYGELLSQLLDNSEVNNHPSLKSILENELEELLSQEMDELTPKQRESFEWTQKFFVDQKISQLAFERLQQIHQSES